MLLATLFTYAARSHFGTRSGVARIFRFKFKAQRAHRSYKGAIEATPKMAEEEVGALKTKLEALEEQQKQAHDLLKTMQAASQQQGTPGAEDTPPKPETRQLVVVPNEHRLRKFSGRQGENELSIDDFIDNAKSAITSRGLPPSEQANFTFSYLEGPTKEETKLFPKSDLKEPEKIFGLLQESFGEKRSVPNY